MVRVTTFNPSAGAPRGLNSSVPWKKGDLKPAGLPMPEDLMTRIQTYQAYNLKKGPLEYPKVHWACPPGIVPGDRKEKTIKDLNSNRQTVKDRGNRVHEMTEALARELGFKHAIIKGNTHATKTMMRTAKTRTGMVNIKTYEKDDVHFTITLTDDLSKIQVSGHIYTTGDSSLIPSDVVKFRVIYGNPKPGIDLNQCVRTAMRR